MTKYYVGDPDKFKRVTTSIRIREEQLKKIKEDRMNFSNWIEDCLDYYWGIRNPIDDFNELKRRADAAAKAKAAPISQELTKIEQQVSKMEKGRTYCERLKMDVFKNFFEGPLCDGGECEFYKSGECRFAKKE